MLRITLIFECLIMSLYNKEMSYHTRVLGICLVVFVKLVQFNGDYTTRNM